MSIVDRRAGYSILTPSYFHAPLQAVIKVENSYSGKTKVSCLWSRGI